MAELDINWDSPGPVASAFMRERAAWIQGILGPIGAGKTSTAMVKSIVLAQEQRPSPRDNIRKFKVCMVRDTYRQLWKTTIPTWWRWISKDTGKWVGGDGEPAHHEIDFRPSDDIDVHFEIDFVGIGEHRAEDVLRGYEPTIFILEEADLMAPDVLAYARGRIGRYPTMEDGGPTWSGILLAYNAPDEENYLYRVFEEEKPEGHILFRQPNALSEAAENKHNLPSDYYEKQMAGQEEWYIRRMIRAEYGFVRGVEPIYPEYNEAIHYRSEPIPAVKGIPLIIGADAGMTPAGIFLQYMPDGQWRALREIATPKGASMGATRFGEYINRILKEHYPEWTIDEIVGAADPSTSYGGDEAHEDDRAWLDKVRKVTKLHWRPAPSNAPAKRWEAVRQPLTKMIDGHKPGLIISSDCPMLRRGFNSGYRFHVIEVPGSGRYHNTGQAEKNMFSHPHDALQYPILTFSEGYDVETRGDRQHGRRQVAAETEDNPGGTYQDRHGRQTEAIVD